METFMTLDIGDRVNNRNHPEWGVGQVIENFDDGMRAFFLNVGWKDLSYDKLMEIDLTKETNNVFEFAQSGDWTSPSHSVYVVELNRDVLNDPKFEVETHGYSGPCVYVGETQLNPEQRFLNHKFENNYSYFVARYGKNLLPDLYEAFNPIPWRLRKKLEEHLALLLRSQGFQVWPPFFRV